MERTEGEGKKFGVQTGAREEVRTSENFYIDDIKRKKEVKEERKERGRKEESTK